jgi:hypothetical protein
LLWFLLNSNVSYKFSSGEQAVTCLPKTATKQATKYRRKEGSIMADEEGQIEEVSLEDLAEIEAATQDDELPGQILDDDEE